MMRVIVVGCLGRMGVRVCALLADSPDMCIAAGVDVAEEAPPGYPYYRAISDVPDGDCIISLLPSDADDATLATLDFATRSKTPLVICTTGLCENTLAKIREAAGHAAILHSPNMSLGANFLAWMLGKITKPLYEAGFDIEITETHHNKKQDAPSGTAMGLGDVVLRELGQDVRLVFGRSPNEPPRKKGDVGMHAIRAGGIVGQHSILFGADHETITISHSALNRDVFAAGTIAAARFLASQPPGLYSMADLFGRGGLA